jgi:hypothetical protein
MGHQQLWPGRNFMQATALLECRHGVYWVFDLYETSIADREPCKIETD